MITEDYVSFETAKLLKEKGFNEKCGPYYGLSGVLINGVIIEAKYNVDGDKFSAPTLQMAMKWLREIYKLEVRSTYDYDKDSWWGNINPMFEETDENSDIYQKALGFDYQGKSYEQAAEAAIKYCLETLINNDKNDECEDNADEPFAMEQDLGQLLMNSLCAILPYGVIVLDGPAEQRGKLWSVSNDYMVSYESDVSEELERQSIFNVRCYLRSMSNMTEEEKIAYNSLCQHEVDDMGNEWFADTIESFDWLNAHHFDYRGLIKKGRALEAPEDMYK